MADSKFSGLPIASATADTDLVALSQDMTTTPVSKSSSISVLRNGIIGSSLTVGNLNLTANTFSSTDTNGDINIYPNGTGRVKTGVSGVTSTMRGIITNGPSADLSYNGSGMHHFTSADLAYPTKQFLNTSHDAIAEVYDAYFSGINWISSDIGSNFIFQKGGDLLRMGKSFGKPVGSTFSWDYFWIANTAGAINTPFQPSVNAYRTSSVASVIGGSAWYTVPFNSTRFLTNLTFNTSTGVATALAAGKYTINFAATISAINNTRTIGIARINTSNKTYIARKENIYLNQANDGQICLNGGTTADVDIGDTFSIDVYANGTVGATLIGSTSDTWVTALMGA
jgi:hypothetical protein